MSQTWTLRRAWAGCLISALAATMWLHAFGIDSRDCGAGPAGMANLFRCDPGVRLATSALVALIASAGWAFLARLLCSFDRLNPLVYCGSAIVCGGAITYAVACPLGAHHCFGDTSVLEGGARLGITVALVAATFWFCSIKSKGSSTNVSGDHVV